MLSPNQVVASPHKLRITSISTEEIAASLHRREKFFRNRRFLSDVCLVLAMMGILLMVADTELILGQVYGRERKAHPLSLLLKGLISVSTCGLVALLLMYHALDTKIFMMNNNMEDFRLALTLTRLGGVCLEVFVCAIHPFPNSLQFSWLIQRNQDRQSWIVDKFQVDITLSLPMFLRFYLVGRVIMLHSRMLQDASAQSLGAFNRVTVNFRFVFKTLMNLYPEMVMAGLITFILLSTSWTMRICEAHYDEFQTNFYTNLWLICITFLSIGYGDIVPLSHCGRATAVFTGMCGAGCTALVVAVLARKLEFSRSEKYVHSYVLDVDLNKRLRHAAANVLRESWLAYKYRRSEMWARALKHTRRLLRSIKEIRELRNERKRIAENTLSLMEVRSEQMSQSGHLVQLQGRMSNMEHMLLRLDSLMVQNLEFQQQQLQHWRQTSVASSRDGVNQ